MDRVDLPGREGVTSPPVDLKGALPPPHSVIAEGPIESATRPLAFHELLDLLLRCHEVTFAMPSTGCPSAARGAASTAPRAVTKARRFTRSPGPPAAAGIAGS